MKVSVSILKEANNYSEAVNKVNNTSADFLHLDITDSTLTPTTSFELSSFSELILYKPLDIHIMSTNLEYQINEAIKLNPDMITIQYEGCNELKKYIDLIKSNNIKVGLAINPSTRLWTVRKYLDEFDLILVMGVKAGFGGQEFIPSVVKKLKKLKRRKHNYLISVDGGIKEDVLNTIKDYVDIVVVGSYVTNYDNYEEQIKKIKK